MPPYRQRVVTSWFPQYFFEQVCRRERTHVCVAMKKGASEQTRENERADARARARASERAGKRARVKERERTLERENERKSESKEKLHTHIWHTRIHVWQTHKYTKHADIKTQTRTQANYCCCAIHHSVYVCTHTHIHTHTHIPAAAETWNLVYG